MKALWQAATYHCKWQPDHNRQRNRRPKSRVETPLVMAGLYVALAETLPWPVGVDGIQPLFYAAA
jgi:hypothetical protein